MRRALDDVRGRRLKLTITCPIARRAAEETMTGSAPHAAGMSASDLTADKHAPTIAEA